MTSAQAEVAWNGKNDSYVTRSGFRYGPAIEDGSMFSGTKATRAYLFATPMVTYSAILLGVLFLASQISKQYGK